MGEMVDGLYYLLHLEGYCYHVHVVLVGVLQLVQLVQRVVGNVD